MSDSRKRAVTPKRGRVRKATLDRGVTVWTDGTLVPANGSVQSSFADVSVAEELRIVIDANLTPKCR